MPDKPRGFEQYEKRFGIIATEKGYITRNDLIEALSIQVHEDIKYGTHRLVGEIFLDQDKMTANQIEEVVHAIFQLQNDTRKIRV
ncbi:MAG: hypothetical protein JRJ21_05540 [Deltaproteobacteria bacterium]|nr:hypothetical protein [Deltaproteobacteria bacterium]